MKPIYVSSGAFSNLKPSESIQILRECGINSIELSAGQPETQWLDINTLKDNPLDLLLHNYFPPPFDPFVINLCSQDTRIVQRSFEHICHAMQITSNLGQSYYSFHAGFLTELSLDNIGSEIADKQIYSREKSLDLFIQQVNELAIIAEQLKIQLLIENNILTKANYDKFGCNPFLMVEHEECIRVMQDTSPNVNLLIDVGHLKVSANTLGFDTNIFLKTCEPWIRAYHLSDNNGLADTNDLITEDSWFWPSLTDHFRYLVIEVYKPVNVLKQQISLVKKCIT